ncbi:hypothetical protein CXG81DRAFT_8405 [Caulochytrium protostelioides]|uniref:5-methyltetrahydropteroyltriglutamate--homocysteine S-methyltransferase n=1 Tax=Caulochytrium protostelioides TaxID=1555241 RepID=A0A4P9WWD0_9FUNG|nr:cobalamin-independent methionine synthase [Caulochytrium protostelioides]RKP04332.1 hypothetical protein CXG81DRAFT_8405 [Caulochytrium protostelioides]|eukprot:RKP04332.1 hypothetical protein CXG81DRAFT_8405 [Caulochytrium protostelioides]
MVRALNLGFPRMGANRDLKKLVEAHWAGKIDEQALIDGAAKIRAAHWKIQADAGIAAGQIPSNDFAFYDQMLDHIALFQVTPARYRDVAAKAGASVNELKTYFAMGRGHQNKDLGIDVPALEMKKWFDTNYHYMVPEFEANQTFSLASFVKPVAEFKEAKALGITTRPVIVGPITFLHLGKWARAANKESAAPASRLALLDALLPVYESLLQQLKEAGAESVQIDEPILTLDLPTEEYKPAYDRVYSRLGGILPILLASYFGRYGENLDRIVKGLKIQTLHADLVRAPEELDALVAFAKDAHVGLSLGLIDGRNIWKADLAAAKATVEKVLGQGLPADQLFVSPSCSLLHSPHSLAAEEKMNPVIKNWLAFAVEKLDEVVLLAKSLAPDTPSPEVQAALAQNRAANQDRAASKLIRNDQVQARMADLKDDLFNRAAPYPVRAKEQADKLKLPLFPTTTIGSLPQTKEIRMSRLKLKKGEMTEQAYDEFIGQEILGCIKKQEEWGLDVLVHGECERNDMVEYFGERLDGYVFSQNGWVQSYGSRCVKPPIIFGDVSRPKAMTVRWSKYAAERTEKPMKGMLTGPVTMLQWSFVRNDQPRKLTTYQLALAIRDEVVDLETAGIACIQIDEPAIREGLPLRRSDWATYLEWASAAFRLSAAGVQNATQIHSHFCYSDFNDIFPTIQSLDADVITIENSRSDLKLLKAFEQYGYQAGIGPGIYDIHSPRVPSVEEMKERVDAMLVFLKKELLWLNPDCGLKTRGWAETEAALKNLCTVARQCREAATA